MTNDNADPDIHTTGPAQRKSALLIAAIVFILLLAGYLRFGAVQGTLVDHPFRADAAQYYVTAYNLQTYGVYSQTIHTVDGQEVAPAPDDYRTPGYPLFLALFVDGPPNLRTMTDVAVWQALLSTLTVGLVLLLFLRIGNPWLALPAALLTAMSPHLVNASIYMLSETLFTLLLILSILVFSLQLKAAPRGYALSLLGTGLLLGAAALTRPIMEFFPFVLLGLLFSSYPWRHAARGAALLLLGFALVCAPWVARNYICCGESGDSSTLLGTAASGVYPDLEYNHDPASREEPGRQDPRFDEITRSLGSIGAEIGRRLRENPGEELRWYLVGKPVMLWSWDINEGGRDAFIYPVFHSPYSSSPPFQLTHALMRGLHWILVVLALLGCIVVWLPSGRVKLEPGYLLVARCMSLLLLYNTVILMALAPFVRYSIPFLPLQYGMALTFVYILYLIVRPRFAAAIRHRPVA